MLKGITGFLLLTILGCSKGAPLAPVSKFTGVPVTEKITCEVDPIQKELNATVDASGNLPAGYNPPAAELRVRVSKANTPFYFQNIAVDATAVAVEGSPAFEADKTAVVIVRPKKLGSYTVEFTVSALEQVTKCSATIKLNPVVVPLPVVTMNVTPTTIPTGESVLVYYVSENALSCQLSQNGVAVPSRPTNILRDTFLYGPLVNNSTADQLVVLTVTCLSAIGQSVFANVTVTVKPPPAPTPTPLPSATPLPTIALTVNSITPYLKLTNFNDLQVSFAATGIIANSCTIATLRPGETQPSPYLSGRNPGIYFLPTSLLGKAPYMYVGVSCLVSANVYIVPPRVQVVPFGQWVETERTETKGCVDVCDQVNRSSTSSREGMFCASGENRPSDLNINYNDHFGCPNGVCSPEPHAGADSADESLSRFCYHPGQKEDFDATDWTVACYCSDL